MANSFYRNSSPGLIHLRSHHKLSKIFWNFHRTKCKHSLFGYFFYYSTIVYVRECVVDFILIPRRCTIHRVLRCEIPLSFLNTYEITFWKKSVAALEQVIVRLWEGTIAQCFQLTVTNCDVIVPVGFCSFFRV